MAIVPSQLSIEVEPVPDILRQEEVVALNLTVEGGWWDVHVGVATAEVVMPSIGLVD